MKTLSRKYDDIMNAGRELFWKYGFRRVTVDEICTKAGVCKMTFYKYFPDKIDLAKRIFDRIIDDGLKKTREIFREDTPATEKINKLIVMKLDSTNNISPEFLQDFYMGSSELKNYVSETTLKVWNSLVQDIREAQKSGTFRKDFRPELIIKIQTKVSELINDSEVTSLYNSRQEMIMEFSKFMFYGIAPHDCL